MLILQGFVKNVILKNEDNTEKNTYAIVGFDDISIDKDGFEVTILRKIMVAGNDFKKGLHNSYRSLIGSEVFAPCSVDAQMFNGKIQQRFNLIGPPLRLAESRPVQAAPKVAGQ